MESALQEKAKDPIYGYPIKGLDRTAEFSPDDISKNKAIAIIGYIISPLLIIAGLAGRSKFLKFHANQVLVCIVSIIVLAILLIGSFTSFALFTLLYIPNLVVAIPLIGICVLSVIVFRIMGFIFACQGKAKQLPLIGDITIIKWY